MKKPLHALFLDDSEMDAELLLLELQSGGFDVHYRLVDNADDFRAALTEYPWEVILSDFSMPSFTALDALQIVREAGLDVPVIVISGTIGEDTAVSVMKAGASDFFAKGNIKRVVPSVERELREAAERRQRGEAEARFATAFHRSPIGTVITRLSDGAVLDVNQRFLELYNFSRDALIGKTSTDFHKWLKPEYYERIMHILSETGSVQGMEVAYESASGAEGFALVSAEVVELNGETCVLNMVQDITDRKNAERMLRTSEEKFRLLAENSTDMISRHALDGTFLYVSPACETLLGFAPEEMIGQSAYDYFHPDELKNVTGFHELVLNATGSYMVTYRMRRKDGTYTWFETTGRGIRDATGAVVEIHSSSRDVSNRKAAEEAIKRYADRLELLHTIDLAILRDDPIEQFVNQALTRLQPLIGFDGASIASFEDDFNGFTELASIAPVSGYHPTEDRAVIERLKHGEVVYITNLQAIKQPSSSELALLNAGYRSYVRVPLIFGEKLVGSLHIRALQIDAFSSDDIAIIKDVGTLLAIAIENTRLQGIEQRRINELFALHQASLQLTSSLDVEQVLDTILDYALLLIQADNAQLFLYDGEKLTFGTAQFRDQEYDPSIFIPREDGLTYTVARTGERVVVPNVNEHPIYTNWQWGGAIIGLPLRIGNAVVGVISLAYLEPHNFDDNEIRLLELLADQAAIAIHNAQLYEQIQSHAAELEQRVQQRTAELQASETKYRALIEFAPDPIVIIDANGVISLVNQRAEKVFGYERDELIGQSVEVLLPEPIRHAHVEQRMTFTESPGQRVMGNRPDMVARHKNGTEIPVKIGLSPITAGDETLVMAYIADVTADRQLETSLRTALAREKELNELKTSFTSIVSHEFRTPLSVILSSTELLMKYSDRMEPERRVEKLNNITRQVGRLIKLMDDALTITRAEGTGFHYQPAPIDIVTLCEEILDDVRAGYHEHAQLELVTSGNLREVMTDEFLFSHILQNLTTNAVKYSPDGGIVRVVLACDDAALTLRVEDKGIGIPERDQSRLFEAFRRAGNVGHIQGTGIGLTIVKRAVDACGGKIDFESTEGAGTTFVVTLPISQASEAGNVPSKAQSSLSQG